jgi:drug/metabolite transporter (DMT)-like permease
MTARATDNNITGMVSIILGVMVFSVQDAILKFLSSDYPVTQAIVFRCIVALPLLLMFVRFETGRFALKSRNLAAVVLRGLILLVAYTTYYMALPALPLAEAVALFFISPIIVTLLAALALRETVTAASWLAVIVGFVGVLIILQPGSALFEPAALFSLASAATYALSMIIARKIGGTETASIMAFYQNIVYLLGAAAMAAVITQFGSQSAAHPSIDFLVRPWVWPVPRDALLMAACGVIAAFGAFLLTHAYRSAQAKFVAVFEYTGMIWGPLWGFLFFAEIPRWTTVAGMLLILAAGLYALRTASPEPS